MWFVLFHLACTWQVHRILKNLTDWTTEQLVVEQLNGASRCSEFSIEIGEQLLSPFIGATRKRRSWMVESHLHTCHQPSDGSKRLAQILHTFHSQPSSVVGPPKRAKFDQWSVQLNYKISFLGALNVSGLWRNANGSAKCPTLTNLDLRSLSDIRFLSRPSLQLSRVKGQQRKHQASWVVRTNASCQTGHSVASESSYRIFLPVCVKGQWRNR